MREIKVTIDGKEQNLTAEQIENISKMFPKDEWGRKAKGEIYWFVTALGNTANIVDWWNEYGDDRYDFGNYYPTEHIAEMRSLDWQLNNLLFRYAMQHGGRVKSEIGKMVHYVSYSLMREKWEAITTYSTHSRQGQICFANSDIAQSAIKEIIEPFCEKHPEYLDWLRGIDHEN